MLGHLIPDGPVGDRLFRLLDKLPERRVLGRTGSQLGEVRLRKLRVRVVRDGHIAMLRRLADAPVDGVRVRDSCANESKLAGTRHQPPDAKVLVDGQSYDKALVSISTGADFPS